MSDEDKPKKPESLSEAVREYRNRLSLTQKQLSQWLGVTVQTINAWENNRRSPSDIAIRCTHYLWISLCQDGTISPIDEFVDTDDGLRGDDVESK